MTSKKISELGLRDLASLVAKTFEEHGLECILVGGACVSIYSENRYQSSDLDYVTHEDIRKVREILATLGFYRKGRYLVHDETLFFVDFVTPPVAVGHEIVSNFAEKPGAFAKVKLLTPTDCVKDRLAAYFHWNDRESLEQAILVAKHQKIDLSDLKKWTTTEGFSEQLSDFLSQI